MKITTKKTEVLYFSRNLSLYMLQVTVDALQPVKTFKYLEIVSTSDRRRNREIDTGIGKANAVLRELYRSVVTKQELSNTAKL